MTDSISDSMKVSGPLSHRVLQLLVDGKEYTEIGLIEKDLMRQRSEVAFMLSHTLENRSNHNEEYLIEHIAASHGNIAPIDAGNISKTVKNLKGLGFIRHKLVMRKGWENHYYYLLWPDSYYRIMNYIRVLEERYAHEMELEDLVDQKSVRNYRNLDSKRDLCKKTFFLYKSFVEEVEKKQKIEQEVAYLNKNYPVAVPWSPSLAKFKKCVMSIKDLCKTPDKNHGPEGAYAELIVDRLRPELLIAHFSWLSENLLPSSCDDRSIRYSGYYYWNHLDNAPFNL